MMTTVTFKHKNHDNQSNSKRFSIFFRDIGFILLLQFATVLHLSCRYVSDGDKQILRLCSTTVLYSVAPCCTYLIYDSTRYGTTCTNIVVSSPVETLLTQSTTHVNYYSFPETPEHSVTEYNVGQQALTHDTRRLKNQLFPSLTLLINFASILLRINSVFYKQRYYI